MRTKTITSLLTVAILIASASVTSAQGAHVRPRLAPGQTTNWTPHPTTDAPLALTTQDLTTGLTAAGLVQGMLGSGVVVTNVTYNGAALAAGRFQGGTGIIGFDSGIVLSSGDMNSVVGPNLGDGTSTINSTGSDPDLASLIPGYTVYDSAALEFDFSCPTTQVISFQFVFSSEEYNEWVNSPYNDVFGFFVNGQNIAIVPGTSNTPVSINNVNCNNPYAPPSGAHCGQFINNDLNDGGGTINTEMDGLTLVFTATASINPGMNHIKFAIGDAGDEVLDSNVFIRAGSVTCGQPGPVCELPMPALELGAGQQTVSVGTPFSHAIRAIATNGLANQQVTITSVSVLRDGVPAAMPAGAVITPSLPLTGQPATGTFSWTPTSAQVGTWDFVYHLLDQLGGTGIGTVRCVFSQFEDTDCFLFGSLAPASIDLGTGDTLLIDLNQAIYVIAQPNDVPDWGIPDNPQFLGVNFYFQVGLYDPAVFPADPVKCSNGLHIVIGVSNMETYGPSTGITLWSTTPPLLDADFTVNFAIN